MWEQKIIDRQCESTKELMLKQNERPLEDDAEYISLIKFTPIKKEAQCLKEDGSIDLNVREFTNEELTIESRLRGHRGATIEKIRGDKAVSTINEEKKERAITAFLAGSTLDAIKNRFKAIMSGLRVRTLSAWDERFEREKHEDS